MVARWREPAGTVAAHSSCTADAALQRLPACLPTSSASLHRCCSLEVTQLWCIPHPPPTPPAHTPAPAPATPGTRLAVHAGCGMLVKMPLLTLLAQQAALMALSANPGGYCATPLLAHPLTRRRLHRLWVALEAVPTVLPYTTGVKRCWCNGEGVVCRTLAIFCIRR